MAYFKPKHPLSDAQERWVLLQVARRIPVPDIWRMICGKVPGRPIDVEQWDGPKDAFRKKIGRLTKGQASKNTPSPGSQQRGAVQGIEQPDPSPVDISGIDAQTTWLQDFITRNMQAKPGDRLRALQMLRELQDRLDSDGKSDDRTLLEKNPRYIKIDTSYLNQLIMIFREEVGGLHNLSFECLNLQELELLIKEIARVHAGKSGGDNLHTLLDGIEHKSEIRSAKLFRIRQEIKNLTEEEIKALEDERDLEVNDDDQY